MFCLNLITDPILFQRLTEEPFFQTTKAVLELGPNVTEAVLQAFLNATKVEVLNFPFWVVIVISFPRSFPKCLSSEFVFALNWYVLL